MGPSRAGVGAALFAAVAAGAASLQTPWPQPTERVEPDPEAALLYDELYGWFRELAIVTRHAAHALAVWQRDALRDTMAPAADRRRDRRQTGEGGRDDRRQDAAEAERPAQARRAGRDPDLRGRAGRARCSSSSSRPLDVLVQVVLLVVAFLAVWSALTRKGVARGVWIAVAVVAAVAVVVIQIVGGEGFVLSLLVRLALLVRRAPARAVRAEARRALAQAERDPGQAGAGRAPRRADHEPQVRRREGREVPPRGRVPRARDRAGRPAARRRPAPARARRHRPRRRRGRHGRRRRLAGAGRQHRRRARRADGGHPGRHAQPLRPRHRPGPRRRGRRARRLRRGARARRSTSPT